MPAMLLVVLWFLGAFAAGASNDAIVDVKFTVDGKRIAPPSSIAFLCGFTRAEVPIQEDRIRLERLRGCSGEVAVIVPFSEVEFLRFDRVPFGNFTGHVEFGLEHRPFSPTHRSAVPKGKSPRRLFFIRFDPPDGVGTSILSFR
jgi:hypothetical protein